MVGMNPLCGRIADNALLYLVTGLNSYRFVIDSYNEYAIYSSYFISSFSPSLSVSFSDYISLSLT